MLFFFLLFQGNSNFSLGKQGKAEALTMVSLEGKKYQFNSYNHPSHGLFHSSGQDVTGVFLQRKLLVPVAALVLQALMKFIFIGLFSVTSCLRET